MRNFMSKSVNIITLIIMAIVIILVSPAILNAVSMLTLLAILGIVFGLGYILNRYSDKIADRHLMILMFSILLAMIIFQVYMVIKHPYIPKKGDYEAVYTGIKELVNYGQFTQSEKYFLHYPHQLFTTLIYTVFNRILFALGASEPISLLASNVLNILLLDIGILLIFFAVKNLSDSKTAFLSFILMALNSSYYGCSAYLYPHSLSIVFIAFAVYALSLIKNESEKKKKYWVYAFIGFTLALAKSVEGIFLIGIIAAILYFLVSNNFKAFLVKSIVTVAAFLLTLFCIGQVYTALGIFTVKENNIEIPLTHWIMMGLKDDGKYNEEDYTNTVSLETTEEKQAYNVSEIKSRLGNMTAKDLLDLIVKKEKTVWTGTKYGISLNSKLQIKYDIGYRMSLFVLALMSAVFSLKYKKCDFLVYKIWLIGVFAFIAIWEASAVYLFSSMPILVMSAVPSLTYLKRSTKSIPNNQA